MNSQRTGYKITSTKSLKKLFQTPVIHKYGQENFKGAKMVERAKTQAEILFSRENPNTPIFGVKTITW